MRRTSYQEQPLSSESIAEPSRPGMPTTVPEPSPDGGEGHGPADSSARCSGCGAPLAADQRYCLECGEPRVPVSSFLLGSTSPQAPAPSSGPPSLAPPGAPVEGSRRGGWLAAIAFVGVLLLAMGVGVLIGRAGNTKQVPAAPEVVTVDSGGGGTTGAASSGEVAFTGDWPAGTSGYTIQLETLPQAGTAVSAVESAKATATAKGAKVVGALKSEEFSSLPSGQYVIYSGVYHSRSEAAKQLAPLKKTFPQASVVHVSSGGGGGAASSGGSSAGASGQGSTPNHPAPPSVLKSLNNSKGKSYEEKSKNLPNVVETG